MKGRIISIAFGMLPCLQGNTQLKSGLTHQRDSSFTIESEYKKNSKDYPGIRIAQEYHSDKVKEKRNLQYGNAGERKLMLDLFYPKNDGEKLRTALIFLHGGGWRSGQRSMHYPLAQHLADMGYVCITPEYRLSTDELYPAAIYDIKAAVRWVRKNAAKYHIDPSHIVIGGHSAGGELAAFVASTNGDPVFEGSNGNQGYGSTVNALIDIDGILSFDHAESAEGDDSKKISAATYWLGYGRKDNPVLWHEASPLTHVGSNAVPSLFLNSSVARMHAGREDYIKVLQQYNITSEVKTFDKAPHSFCFFDPWFTEMIETMNRFMKKVFADPI
jgi:pectinesterase